MEILVNLDVMMAKRKISAGELAERVGITPANLSILKNNKAKAIRFSTLMALCHELRCRRRPAGICGRSTGGSRWKTIKSTNSPARRKHPIGRRTRSCRKSRRFPQTGESSCWRSDCMCWHISIWAINGGHCRCSPPDLSRRRSICSGSRSVPGKAGSGLAACCL